MSSISRINSIENQALEALQTAHKRFAPLSTSHKQFRSLRHDFFHSINALHTLIFFDSRSHMGSDVYLQEAEDILKDRIWARWFVGNALHSAAQEYVQTFHKFNQALGSSTTPQIKDFISELERIHVLFATQYNTDFHRVKKWLCATSYLSLLPSSNG